MKTENVKEDILIRLSKYITRRAFTKWNTYLRTYEDEILSESFVAVTSTLKRYPELPNYKHWYRNVALYAYGMLIAALRKQRYIPTDTGIYNNIYTNVEDIEGYLNKKDEQMTVEDMVGDKEYLEMLLLQDASNNDRKLICKRLSVKNSELNDYLHQAISIISVKADVN